MTILSALRKVIDRQRIRWSYFTCPKDKVSIRQSRVAGYDLVVLVNEDVGRQIDVLGRYEPTDSEFLRRHIRASDICFDIGANVGYYSLLMAMAAPAGKVYAFEPVPISYHLVCLNSLVNKRTNIAAHQLAIGAYDGETSFSQAADGAFSSLVAVGRKQSVASITTHVRTLDSFCLQYNIPRIDVMKVDVEGAEMLVVQGGRKMLGSDGTRPRIILMELYDPNFRPYNTSIEAVVEAMAGFGYAPFIINPTGTAREFGGQHHNVCPNVFFIGSNAS
jgi:FkbM family methyltransferase